jgi:ATP-dependent phosphofructokinase / diphosphate-dependent phosphofructokinase
MAERVGVLTGGGDCPGLNAVIRAIVRKSLEIYNYEIVGLKKGWLGILDMDYEVLDREKVSGILHRGGTILRTSRTNPLKMENGIKRIIENANKLNMKALIAVGGEDTLGVAQKLHENGMRVVGVPKTIDNDLEGTDYTFGFDTAVNIAMEAIDRVHTTAESHNRVMVVEVMGRHTGWIALEAGIAGGADVILIPEKPFELDEICQLIMQRHQRGRDFSIVVVAEGAKFKSGGPSEEGTMILQDMQKDAFGHVRLGGIGSILAKEIENKTGYESRVVILGHIQRGGSPTAFDRVLATRFGIAAIDMIHNEDFGKMAALRGNKIVSIPILEAVNKLKTISEELYQVAEVFFG